MCGRQAAQLTGAPSFAPGIITTDKPTLKCSMVGALNKLPVAASGLIFFGDVVTFGSVSAIGVGFFAGLVYAVAKSNQKKAENRNHADSIIPLANRKS